MRFKSFAAAARAVSAITTALAATAAPSLAAGPLPTAPPPGANIFLIREHSRTEFDTEVRIDSYVYAWLPRDRYTAFRLAPGPHRFRLRWPGEGRPGPEFDLTIEEGRTYYFQVYRIEEPAPPPPDARYGSRWIRFGSGLHPLDEAEALAHPSPLLHLSPAAAGHVAARAPSRALRRVP